MGRAGIGGLAVLALAGLVAGVALPMAIERTVGQRPWPTLLLFGRRVRSSSMPTEAASAAPG
jgi:hypothetical protein